LARGRYATVIARFPTKREAELELEHQREMDDDKARDRAGR
jgi:hypothetical protein